MPSSIRPATASRVSRSTRPWRSLRVLSNISRVLRQRAVPNGVHPVALHNGFVNLFDHRRAGAAARGPAFDHHHHRVTGILIWREGEEPREMGEEMISFILLLRGAGLAADPETGNRRFTA